MAIHRTESYNKLSAPEKAKRTRTERREAEEAENLKLVAEGAGELTSK